jgi:hypothetical protein
VRGHSSWLSFETADASNKEKSARRSTLSAGLAILPISTPASVRPLSRNSRATPFPRRRRTGTMPALHLAADIAPDFGQRYSDNDTSRPANRQKRAFFAAHIGSLLQKGGFV